MTQTATLRILRGVAALAVILAITIGLPVGLALGIGWPLPHVIPNVTDVTTSLTQSQLSDQVIIKILAVICWLCWVQMTASILVEAVAAFQRRPARQLFAAGPMQAVAAQLIAAVLFIASVQPKHTPIPVSSTFLVQPVLSVATTEHSQSMSVVQTSSSSTPTALVVKPAVAIAKSTYTVRHRDTLWGIADAKLGDPQRWKEIYELNRGRTQPDGEVFTKARLIRPGWVLELPQEISTTTTPVATSPVTATTATQQLSLVPADTDVMAPSDATSPTPTSTTQPPITNAPLETEDAKHTNPVLVEDNSTHESLTGVVLASGSVVGLSTASGIAVALGLVRLRRRRNYKPGDPQPGIATGDPLLTESIKRLTYAANNVETEGFESATTFVSPAPGVASLGERDGVELLEDLTKLGSFGLHGQNTLEMARGIVVSFLAHRTDDETQVLVVGDDLGGELFAKIDAVPGLRFCPSLSDVLNELDVEVVGRTRLLEEAEVVDIDGLRSVWPEEPVPAILVVTRPDERLAPRMNAIAEAGQRLGLGFVIVDSEDGHNVIDVRESEITTIIDSTIGGLDGARVYGMSTFEAVEILGTLAAARTVDDNTVEYQPLVTEPFEPPIITTQPTTKLVQIRVLGLLSITVDGVEVSSGLRSNAWELLAFLALRPQGVTKELAIEMMWPTRVNKSAISDFRAAVNSLRTELRVATGRRDLQFVERVNGRFRLNAELVDCDVWEFEANLERVRVASVDEKVAALDAAAVSYGGSFAAGSDYLWSEECREDLKNRLLDVLCTMAKLHERDGDLDATLVALERAAEIEPANEATLVEIMRVQGLLGLHDAATRTMRRLRREAERLGTRPSSKATKLFADLQNENVI